MVSSHLRTSVFYDNAHAAARYGHHAHSGLDIGGVEVGHLDLSDFMNLLFGDGGDLRLVGDAGTALDLAFLFDEDCSRGGLVTKVKERSA